MCVSESALLMTAASGATRLLSRRARSRARRGWAARRLGGEPACTRSRRWAAVARLQRKDGGRGIENEWSVLKTRQKELGWRLRGGGAGVQRWRGCGRGLDKRAMPARLPERDWLGRGLGCLAASTEMGWMGRGGLAFTPRDCCSDRMSLRAIE
ncbi:hypothetical protein BDV96DRAFT_352130 [Lophiotrema nucula]|uniref:Uncharacterized protein n=1 Tax=Lophiotrema nucula TaxID=690887 RepID=A0A6A5ZMS2_9PLEO|nr:hypothetical protein BDV96DRAFT_352130 [Lophiotrema nucula]